MSEQEYTVPVKQGRMSSMVPGLLSGHHTGHVHSLFRTSLNLKFGDHLIHLGTEEYGLCCFGLTVPENGMELILESCKADSLVAFKQNRLYLYGTGHLIILELESFETVDLRIPAIHKLISDSTEYKRQNVCGQGQQAKNPQSTRLHQTNPIETSLLYQQLETMADTMELGLEREENFRRYSRILAETDNEKETEEAAAFFYGRGKGLTPGGDDILTGYGAVLQAFGKADGLISTLQKISAKTTEVSGAYLSAMQKGYANEIFCDLILQLKANEVLKLQRLLCRMERIGNTSGCDTLYGMYLAFTKMKEEYRV